MCGKEGITANSEVNTYVGAFQMLTLNEFNLLVCVSTCVAFWYS